VRPPVSARRITDFQRSPVFVNNEMSTTASEILNGSHAMVLDLLRPRTKFCASSTSRSRGRGALARGCESAALDGRDGCQRTLPFDHCVAWRQISSATQRKGVGVTHRARGLDRTHVDAGLVARQRLEQDPDVDIGVDTDHALWLELLDRCAAQARRMCEAAAHLVEHVLPEVPIRQSPRRELPRMRGRERS
jgi:hypothetical protein